jgi:hypothetical protein
VAPAFRGPGNDFTGSLASMSIGALVQFLNSEKETGALTLLNDRRTPLGTMIFIKGEVVDAVSPGQRGVEAVFDIVAHSEGFFSFTRKKVLDPQKTVDQQTIPLLMEAYRRIDEKGAKQAAVTS